MMPNREPTPFNRFARTLPLLRSGTLEARLARSEKEIEAAQILRYEVFYDECGAQPDETMALLKRDVARIDDFCL